MSRPRSGISRRGIVAIAAAFLVTACGTGGVEVPEHGMMRLDTPHTSFSVTVPSGVAATIRPAGPGTYRFGAPDATPQTVHGSISSDVTTMGILGSFAATLAGRSDAELLAAYLDAVAPAEQARPGRPGNRLRAYTVEARARPEHAARGLACGTRRITAEDRAVPGQPGRLYLYHALHYTCIDPESRVPVELVWAERFRAGTNRLSAGFESDAERFFSSLRFLERPAPIAARSARGSG